MSIPINGNDPRVKRTPQLLLQAFIALLEERQNIEETRETTALILSWAIFGPAVQWSRGERTIPAEKMIQDVLAVVIAGLSPLITVT